MRMGDTTFPTRVELIGFVDTLALGRSLLMVITPAEIHRRRVGCPTALSLDPWEHLGALRRCREHGGNDNRGVIPIKLSQVRGAAARRAVVCGDRHVSACQ